jgi:hypothetical protein
MSGASPMLQAVAIAALQGAEGIGGVYDGLPLQAAFPYAVVECGPESDWSHKSGTGREVRLAVTIRDEGERPARLRRLMREAEAAIYGIGGIEGWRIVSLHFVRSQGLRETRGSDAPGVGRWAGVIEFRERMLQSVPEP